MGYSSLGKIPKEICKLTKLRHLLGKNMHLCQLKNSLGGMRSLQTLHRVKLTEDDAVELLGELEKLQQLRNLGLGGVDEGRGSALCWSINKMQNLEKLHIDSFDVIDFSVIPSLPMLRNLSLDGKLNKFEEWVPQFQNLVELSLNYSHLTDDPLKSLQNMPHLLLLNIGYRAYEGESLYFQHGGFQRLKQLNLFYLLNLNSIIIDKGALGSLETLRFERIYKLETVPPGIKHSKKLEVLNVFGMPYEFEQCIAPDGGPEHPSIQHVPLVRILAPKQRPRVIHHSRH